MGRRKKEIAPAVEEPVNESVAEETVAVEPTVEAAEVETPVEPTVSSEPIATSWKVFGARGFIRTYNIADHGFGAQALAEQFANKVGGRVEAE